MSTTFTIPPAAGDHFTHASSDSFSKSHAKHSRTNGRLAPPMPLPRIPSESLHHSSEQDSFLPQRDVDFTTRSPAATPRYDVDGALMVKRMSVGHEHKSPVVASHPGHCQHGSVSKPTEALLRMTEPYALLHGIIADQDSRRIFYFMLLNLSFMVVQSTYGYLTGSLGLISDSIHMFFDCVALLVGLCAAVMSKWPPSLKFPYGYGKIDTLAGLGNGIFLMLISVEIVYEATERLFSGADISRTTELLVVSTIGLIVNMVGIFAFHGHHGHSHGHNHGHEHDDRHGHHHREHSLADVDNHDQLLSHTTDSSAGTSSPTRASHSKTAHAQHGHGHTHGHSHSGENMQGIYLHIMADALGSVAVVISTLLVQLTGWSGWDPIASCIIAVLIFISTIPLVTSTTEILLLSLNPDAEYNLRDILSGVSSIRGVVGYAVPRFWMGDAKTSDGHGHGHGHHHHSHDHDHDHGDNGDHDAKIMGVIHVIARETAELTDVRHRVSSYLNARHMDVVVQVERENEGRCFCGGGLKTP